MKNLKIMLEATFCSENNIIIPDLEDNVPGRIRCKHATTYDYHLRVVIFYQVIDRVSQEMNNRFSSYNQARNFLCV